MEMSDAYPLRNPFPHQGTLRLAGQRLDGSIPNLAGDFRTIFRRPIGKLERFLSDSLSRFQPEWSGDGGTAFVRGRHGSGKTHTLFAAWQKFAKDGRVFPVYTVAQESDFTSLYRQFTGRLSLPLLIELSRGLLANMAVEELAAKGPLPKTAQDPGSEGPPVPVALQSPGGAVEAAEAAESDQKELRQVLKSDQKRVKKLFSSYAVEEGAAKARQRGTLTDLTQGNSDLGRAVQCLQGDQFAADAADWLCMRPVTAQKLQAMGIAAPIGSAQQAAAALELLAALFTVVDRPLILFIDQCEKLAEGNSPAALANSGLVRSLIEAFESRNAALVLAGTQEGWDCLPEDARQRIGLNVIDSEFLTLDEALDLVRLYVTPLQEEFRPGVGGLFPFTEDAVREILQLSAGNPRKLLQYCHVMFRRAEPTRAQIDVAMVNSTAQAELANQFFDQPRVVQETRRILARQHYGFREEFSLAGMRFDFALLEDQRPVVVVNVSGAVFGRDEASNALLAADTVKKLRTSGELATFVLVVTGYVSPEVTAPLSRVVNELIVFAPEDFERRLESVLERARLATPAPTRDELSEADRAALRALSQIGTKRVEETRIFEKREGQVVETHEQRRYAERRDMARRDWIARREQLELNIANARKAREIGEWESMEKERKAANVRRWSLDAALALIIVVMVVVALEMASFSPNVAAGAIISGAVALLIVAWELMLLFLRADWILKSLSEEELIRLAARNEGLAMFTFIRTPTTRFLANSRLIRRSIPMESIADMIKAEPLRTLRVAYCRLIADLPVGPDMTPIYDAAPEAALLVGLGHEPPKDAEAPLDLVAALNGFDVRARPRLAYDLCSASFRDTPLSEAWKRGLDRVDLGVLSSFTERQIRGAVRELSPTEPNGLGTYDFLPEIEEVDQAFLFCCQLLLYFERDLLDSDQPQALPEAEGPRQPRLHGA